MKPKSNLKKSEKTRRLIIEKTAPIFNKKGVSGTSLSDLTKATGLTKGSIYGNFKDKNAVAIAAYDYNVNMLLAYLNKSMNRQVTYVEKLLAIPEAYRRLYQHTVAFGGCPIANTATESDDTHPELKRRVTATIMDLTDQIHDLVENGKRKGEIQCLTDSRKTAEIIMSLVEGGVVLSKTTDCERYLEHSLEQVEYLIHTIRLQE